MGEGEREGKEREEGSWDPHGYATSHLPHYATFGRPLKRRGSQVYSYCLLASYLASPPS